MKMQKDNHKQLKLIYKMRDSKGKSLKPEVEARAVGGGSQGLRGFAWTLLPAGEPRF